MTMGSEPFVVAPLEARYHKGANAESAAGGHLVVQAFTVTGNDFSTGDGISPTIRAGSDRQNTTPMVVVPVQDGRGMEKAQNGFGVGEPGDPMYTPDTAGAQAVAYEVVLPCNIDGAQIAPTLRGFGHGWQGQHNTTNAVAQCINGDTAGTLDANYGKGPGERSGVEREVVVQSATWGYDEYNDSITEELHHSLRAGTRQSNGVVQLFEPMSLREENWAERDIKNALRAEASKSSHAVVDRPEPFALLNFQGSKSNTVVNDGSVSFTLNAMHGHDMHVVGYEHTTTETIMEPATNLVVRRLTPLECELLMGWEPNWTAEGVEEDGTVVKMADTHRYRMCGNGVVSNVGEWIGIRYLAAKQAATE